MAGVGRTGFQTAMENLQTDLMRGWASKSEQVNPAHLTGRGVALKALEKLTSEARKSYRAVREGATDAAARGIVLMIRVS